LAGWILPAAVDWPANGLCIWWAASITALYPATLACEDKTSYDWPLDNVRNNVSKENIVAFCFNNWLYRSTLTLGWITDNILRFSIFFASSNVGGRTLATTSAFHASSLDTTSAPAFLYWRSVKPLPKPAPLSILTVAPAFLSLITFGGVNATLNSPSRLSFGTPTDSPCNPRTWVDDCDELKTPESK
jgi:hypothetical protein